MTRRSHTARTSFRRRTATAVVVATVALLTLVSVAQADIQSFPVTSSGSILAPTNAGSGAVNVETSCNWNTHAASVRVDVQTPMNDTAGLWVDITVIVKNHATSTWTGSLTLAHRQQYVPSTSYATSSGGWLTSFATVIPSTPFYGPSTSHQVYDVAVVYQYARPGSPWSSARVLFESQYKAYYNGAVLPYSTTSCYL